MKLQLNANEKLTIQTPFGEITLSVDQFGANLIYQNDNVKELGSTGNGFTNENGDRIHLNTTIKGSSYKKIQIAIPYENNVRRDDLFFFFNESKNARSNIMEADAFLEYWNIEDFEELDDYRQIEEYLFENHILLEENTLDDIEDYMTVTNFK